MQVRRERLDGRAIDFPELAHRRNKRLSRRNPTLIEFTATYDGRDCPLEGYPGWDSIAMKRIDAYTNEFTQSRGGKVTLTGKRVVSKDGETMTVTAKGTNAKEEPVDLAMVF